jgi:hypothetical protein
MRTTFTSSKYNQGIFTPKNPQKYVGKNKDTVVYRSGWEKKTMEMFDAHPYILQWSSESISIPYTHPLLRRNGRPVIRMYIPDFLVVWADKNGKKSAELWEIKPMKENPWSGAA